MAYSQLVHDLNYFKDLNKIRYQLGLPLLKKQDRACLRCSKVFLAFGRGNHMCGYCAKKAVEYD